MIAGGKKPSNALRPVRTTRIRKRPLAIVGVLLLAAVILPGCKLRDRGDNLVNGKTKYIAKCGVCHTLARANTTGVTGPNLDEAFQRARVDGMKPVTIKGVVNKQILYPAPGAQMDPTTLKPGAMMPAKIYTGNDAEDVAAYVAEVAGKGGEDTGQLGSIGQPKGAASTTAKAGVLDIPADATGALAYEYDSATAKSGELTIRSKNASSVGHNIALADVPNAEGKVVQGGGVSEIKVKLKPGKYVFFCSVTGHREGGMEGTLVVK